MAATNRSRADRPSAGRVLVLDRQSDDLQRLRRYLSREGYELAEAKDARDAFQRVTSGEVDLLILDASDASIDGFSLCQGLHSRPDTAFVPIIAVTDPKGAEDGMTALSLGADDFLTRPLDMASLAVRARMLVRTKELNDGLVARNEQLKQVNAELGRVNRELAHRNRELEQGLQMAHKLQEAMLPQHYPKVPHISFCHLYAPSDIVGGDMFQIAGMENGRAAIFISDVSGHGIRAALVTSIVKTVFQHVYLEDKDPAQVLCDMNSRFRSVLGTLNPQLFATGFLLMIDGPRRRIRLASAGHPCPLLISKDDMSCRPLLELSQIGPALGFFYSPDYPTVERELMPGDIVIGFTDGVYEVVNEAKEMFGLERLQELIARNARLIPRDLIQRIVMETDSFRGSVDRPDDACIVTAEVH